MSCARKKAYFSTNLMWLNSLFVFHACAKAKIWSFYANLVRSFSLALFFPLPFLIISSFVAHFIVLLLHGIVAG